MKGWSKIVLLVLISAAAGATGSAIYHKFSEPKVIVIKKVEKPAVQLKKEPPKTEVPKPKSEEEQPKKQPTPKRQVKKLENEIADANVEPKPERKSNSPSRRELRAFWNRMYELNGMLNNVDSDGFFPQVEISWIKEVRNQLHSMRVPNDPQAEKYHRTFKDRMDMVWFWIFDGNDEMQAQRVLNDWEEYESELLFADEYKDVND